MLDNSFPFITDGIVKDTNDPQQMGRLKIWCPALDGESFDVEVIPWAEYATPFGGVTNNFNSGRNKVPTGGPASYGFWALPKIGSQVLVFLLNGDPNRRFYFASYYGLCRNRSIPAGRNYKPGGTIGPWSDSYAPMQPSFDNIRTAFQNQVDSSQAKTRGSFERQVAQDTTEKTGNDGYATSPVDGYLDPQTYCFVTPGHHVFLMDDAADNCRIRLRTCEGNQVIIDDSNERIYISTSKGQTWVELDEDGHIHVFGSESISMRAGKDINLYADRNINMEAGQDINAKAIKGTIQVEAKNRIDIRSETESIYATACKDMHLLAEKTIYQTATDIHHVAEKTVNTLAETTHTVAEQILDKSQYREIDAGRAFQFGAMAITVWNVVTRRYTYKPFGKAKDADEGTAAISPDSPPIVPNMEPWYRPASAKMRNKYWRE